MITEARLRELLDYEPESGTFIWKVLRRGGAKPGDKAGAANDAGYILIGVEGKYYRAHRLVWLFVHGKWPNFEIDHINGNKADNRLANLRDVPRQLNAENIHRARRNNACGFLGVRAKRNRWIASIKIKGVKKQIGTFDTPEEAHEAYKAAKSQHHAWEAIT